VEDFISLLFKKILFIYMSERERERTSRGSSRGRRRSRLPLNREPNAGLDPRTLGS